tara:strand:+ start:12988 stop:13710 length:723 start_codon:yes stop_codon:yes gene_type:complete
MFKKTKMDVIITVIASRNKIYDQFIELYWVPFIDFINIHYPSILVLMIFGNDESTQGLSLKKENIFFATNPESMIPGIYDKTIECFEYIVASYNYKHVLRTNLSSFFIIEHLMKTSESLSDTNLYAGYISDSGKRISFCSGACIWMSQDIVQILISNKNHIDRAKRNDDIIISTILKDVPRTLVRGRHCINKDINIKNKEALLKDIIDKGIYHIRIKNCKNRQLDVDYMTEFTNFLYKNV